MRGQRDLHVSHSTPRACSVPGAAAVLPPARARRRTLRWLSTRPAHPHAPTPPRLHAHCCRHEPQAGQAARGGVRRHVRGVHPAVHRLRRQRQRVRRERLRVSRRAARAAHAGRGAVRCGRERAVRARLRWGRARGGRRATRGGRAHRRLRVAPRSPRAACLGVQVRLRRGALHGVLVQGGGEVFRLRRERQRVRRERLQVSLRAARVAHTARGAVHGAVRFGGRGAGGGGGCGAGGGRADRRLCVAPRSPRAAWACRFGFAMGCCTNCTNFKLEAAGKCSGCTENDNTCDNNVSV